MKKIILFVLFLTLFSAASLWAQKQSMIISVVEYAEFLDGANSRMFITFPNGKQEEVELKGLFAISGYINEKNIKSNDNAIIKKLNELQRQGWEIDNVVSVIRPKVNTGNNNPPSCIITRYLLIKEN